MRSGVLAASRESYTGSAPSAKEGGSFVCTMKPVTCRENAVLGRRVLADEWPSTGRTSRVRRALHIRQVLAASLVLGCAHQPSHNDAFRANRRGELALLERFAAPRMNTDGVYLVSPAELVTSMSRPGAVLRWLGASVEVSGVVLHVGSADEARVRGINEGRPYVLIADPGGEASRDIPMVLCQFLDTQVWVSEGDKVVAHGEVVGARGSNVADVSCRLVERSAQSAAKSEPADTK